MKRFTTRIGIGGLVLLALVLSPLVAFAATYIYNFSSGSLSPWTGSKDPNVTGYSVSVAAFDNSGTCNEPVLRYANLTLDSRTDNNAGIWMQASYGFASDSNRTVELKWDAVDKGNCYPCKLLVYVGGTAPSDTSVFDSVAYAPSTWTRYSYSKTLSVTDSTAYVALGWRGQVGSLPAAAGIDCIQLTVP